MERVSTGMRDQVSRKRNSKSLVRPSFAETAHLRGHRFARLQGVCTRIMLAYGVLSHWTGTLDLGPVPDWRKSG